MEIPSVINLYHMKLGHMRGIANRPAARGASSFAGEYASALERDEPEPFWELTIVPDKAAQAQEAAQVPEAAQAKEAAAIPEAVRAQEATAVPEKACTVETAAPAAASITEAPAAAIAHTRPVIRTKLFEAPARVLYMSGAKASQSLPLYIPASSARKLYEQSGISSSMGEQVAAFALKHVGIPYVRGGEDLVKGADCSGFVQAVYKHFGVKLPRSERSQAKMGVEVDPDDMKPGDLVFFTNKEAKGMISHVAMYVGNGQLIEARGVKWGVVTTKLAGNWQKNRNFVTARRILPQ